MAFSDKFRKLYDEHSWWGEYCTLCRALHDRREGVAIGKSHILCREHYELYCAEAEAIKAGKSEFPPGLNENGKRVYLIDDDYWVYFRFIEAMVDKGKLSEKEAREEMAVVIEMLQDALTRAEIRQQEIERAREERQHMLPRTRLY